ncbi:FMRFamide receptor-like [Watersipora subatra]|uniref:FMRFamide receptor-like n=1 Tax=Watersipora subatra TaxID=2589382 RepID=UPI00355B6CF9
MSESPTGLVAMRVRWPCEAGGHARQETTFSYKELELQRLATTVIYGWLLNIVCIAGIFGNILSYIVMRSKEYRGSTTAIYLQVLMIVDSLYLLSNLCYYGIIIGCGVGKWIIDPFAAYIRIYVSYSLIDIFRNCSVLLTLVVTAERYICVCHSLKANKVCTPNKSKIISGITVTITVVYEIPRFFILKVISTSIDNCEGNFYTIDASGLVSDEVENVLGILGFVIFLALPLVMLTILTILLLMTIKKSNHFRKSMRSMTRSSAQTSSSGDKAKKANRKSENNTTVILLSVVITALICSLPNTIFTLLGFTAFRDIIIQTLPGSIAYYLAILLLNVNSAANVILFGFFGKKFRRVFARIFIKCYWGERNRKAYQIGSQTGITHTEHLMRENGCHEEGENSMEATESSPLR